MTNLILYCDHVGCPNGCTTRSGMCEACIRERFVGPMEEQERVSEGYRAALEEISKGRGGLSRTNDPFEHSQNIIENMKSVAQKALSPTPEPPTV